MIEILTPDDVSKIKDCYIAEYIKSSHKSSDTNL